MLDLLGLLLGQLVVEATTLDRRNLVLWMRTSDFVSPLHFFRLDDESADLLLSVLGGSEGHNEVRAFFAIGLQLSVLGVHSELLRRVLSEMSRELSILLHVIRQTERDA